MERKDHFPRTSSALLMKIYLIKVKVSTSQVILLLISTLIIYETKHCATILYLSQSTLHGMCSAVWDRFKTADKWLIKGEPAFVVGFHPCQQSVYMASTMKKKKCKSL